MSIRIYVNTHTSRGFSAIEIVFGVSIITFIFIGLLASFNLQIHSAATDRRYIKAGFLAEEGLEAVRSTRDAGWAAHIQNLATATPYYLAWSNVSNSWSATTTATTTDDSFTRMIYFGDVFRNGNDQIVSSGGVYDPDSRLVTATIAWLDAQGTTTRSISTYVDNIYNN